MGYGGGGSKLKVQGTDSYPVNEWIYIYMYTLCIHICTYKVELELEGVDLKEVMTRLNF